MDPVSVPEAVNLHRETLEPSVVRSAGDSVGGMHLTGWQFMQATALQT